MVQSENNDQHDAPNQLLGIRRKRKNRECTRHDLHQNDRYDQSPDSSLPAIRTDSADYAYDHCLQQISISISDLRRIDSAENNQSRYPAEESGGHKYQNAHFFVINSAESGGDWISSIKIQFSSKTSMIEQ